MEERAKASVRLRALVPDVLRTEPQFRLMFAGQVLSLVGDRVMLVALAFAVSSPQEASVPSDWS